MSADNVSFWLRDCPQNFTFALETSLLGQMIIFRTISQPQTLSADIPAAWRSLFTKYSPIFTTARVAKKIWRVINTIPAIWGENMLVYLSLDIAICSSKLTVFLRLRSRKTVCFSEQRIMSANKSPSIFSRQMEATVYRGGWIGACKSADPYLFLANPSICQIFVQILLIITGLTTDCV